ncbi:MAG: heavy metal-responsive transcriptional regulator [Acidimicrobiia bacterium]
MKIGELGNRANVPTKTIRFYEEIGLLAEPDRALNGYRDYGEDAVARLRFIRDAQATGLSLTEIASILDLRSAGEGTCHHVIDLLERHLEDLDRHIENLQATRGQLVSLTGRAKDLDPEDCTDPNRCQTIAAQAEGGTAPRVQSDLLHAVHRDHVSH